MPTTGPNLPVETTDMPTGDTLQPPAQPAAAPQPPAMQPSVQPAAQPQPEQQKPGEHFKLLSHAFTGAILGALAGGKKALGAIAGNEVVDGYQADETGKMSPVKRPLHTGDRMKLIAQAALQGLAAGSQVPQQKSGGASALAGLGAGFGAQQQQAQQQDQMKRQQGKEQYEMEQKTLMDKSIRASHNASTYSLTLKNADDANAHDVERAKNMDIVNSANDYITRNPGTSMKVQILTPEEAKALRNTDPHAIGNYTFLPVGMKVIGEGENAHQVGQVAVISGGNADGKIPLPQSFIDNLQAYGKLAGIGSPEQYKAGMEIPLLSLAAMDKAMNPVKAKETDSWKESKDVMDKDGKHMQLNPYTSATRPYPAGMQPNVKNEVAESAATVQDKLADAEKKRADAGGKNEKPVYAYNQMTKEREQTTRSEMNAHPGVYSHPVDIKESDIRKDTELARQLGDAQMNLSRYRAASHRFPDNTANDRSRMAAVFSDDKLKVGLWGTELPTDWMQKLYTSNQWTFLSSEAQDAIIGYVGARGAVIAYQKAVSGSGRANKEQLELELQNIPTPLDPSNVREKKFDRFQANIDQTGAGLPKMIGVDRPVEIRQRIEAEEAQRAGATHVYEPTASQTMPVDATPVRNIFGKVIGYKTSAGQTVVWPRK